MKDEIYKWIKVLITFSILFTIIASISLCFHASESKTDKFDGMYKLISIQGTQKITANSYGNYLILKDGVCTLYMSFSYPAGSSTHTFSYTCKTSDNVEFEKSSVRMDYNNNIVITLKYDNGSYNVLTYKKIDSSNQ